MESALFKRSRIHTVLKKKVGSGYPTFISNSADPTFYTIRIRLSAQTPSEKKVESALFEKKSDPHGLKKKSDPDIRLSFQTVVDPDPDPLDPYSEAFWIQIRMWNTDPDPHM